MAIEVQQIYKAYHSLQVISDLNLSLGDNKIHCFFGPSGCGKTTLANLIAGLLKADNGTIAGLQDRRMAYVFQEDRLLPWATIQENLSFVLKKSYDKDKLRAVIDYHLKLVELEAFKNSYPAELSGGMRQRVALARALAYEAEIMILDEAFKGVHLELKSALMDYVGKYVEERRLLTILITHDMEEALYLADDIYFFEGLPLKLIRHETIDIPKGERRHRAMDLAAYKEKLFR